MIKDMEIITRITNVKDALIDLLKSVKVQFKGFETDDDGTEYRLYNLIIDGNEMSARYYKDDRLLKIGFENLVQMRMSFYMLKLINAYFISRGYKLFGNYIDKIIWKYYDCDWDYEHFGKELTFERDSEFEEVHKDMKNNRVKFIDYTGSYPNLCSGILRIEINGEELTLSNVLRSGGTWGFDEYWNDYVTHGPWEVDLGCYPNLKMKLPKL